MGVGSGLYMYDVVVKRSRSLSHLLMSSCSCLMSVLLPCGEIMFIRQKVGHDKQTDLSHFWVKGRGK